MSSKREKKNFDGKTVSYSQYSTWHKCAYHWYLDYVKGLRVYEKNLTLTFGNAVHEVIQKYVEVLYTEGLIPAIKLKLQDMFMDKFLTEIVEEKVPYNSEEEIKMFIEEGLQILQELTSATGRLKHFPPDKYEFMGVEVEIFDDVPNKVKMIGYIDLILRDKEKDRYRIIDIKTSAMGWNKYQQEDLTKTSQVVLYKAFYSKKLNIPISKIDVEFFIVKRRLYENCNFPQSRVQLVKPNSSKTELQRVVDHFNQFINECFTPEGKYIEEESNYEKTPGKNKSNCKFCPHRGTNCDAVKTRAKKTE